MNILQKWLVKFFLGAVTGVGAQFLIDVLAGL